ncbi:cysteine desulfurase family protein [Nitratireductor luteus]|uniref:cysteine desulfurase family protein n=1 Tax=Nitratireductor luteus TaxID=2976980 RepID=UPI00223F2881|nr:cysteine desulfurase family protein [Nitratireductor luteus]
MITKRFYLDHNASAPLAAAARTAMLSALEIDANPSSVHGEGRQARRLVEDARRAVAALVNAKAEHVVFTSGATEAATTLLTPGWTMGRAPLTFSRLYVSAVEHPCLLSGGRFTPDAITILPVLESGLLDLQALSDALKAHDRSKGLPLVAIHAANNETGVIQPVDAIGAIARAAGATLVVDAVQAAGRLEIDISNDYADFLILSSHKIGGPKGAGAIVGGSDLMMPGALVRGGGQEKGHRAGTENVAAIAGFGAAARIAGEGLATVSEVEALRDAFEEAVMELVPDAEIHGRGAPRLPNTLFFTIPGLKAETAQIAFDLAGIALSAGSACSSGKVGPSHVLKAMGKGEDTGALRVSIGAQTGGAELDAFKVTLGGIAARRRNNEAAA